MPRVHARSSFRQIVGVVLLLVVWRGGCFAQVQPPVVKPVFHGVLQLIPATGTMDRKTGSGTLVIGRWTFIPNPDSNGVNPATESVLIALGNDSFLIAAGALHRSQGGKLFTYRAPRAPGGRGVRSFRLHHNPDDSFYTVSFKVVGVDLERLNVEDPLCRPLAVIVGDDDGFVSVVLTSPSFASHRVSLPRTCIDPSASWPWLGR